MSNLNPSTLLALTRTALVAGSFGSYPFLALLLYSRGNLSLEVIGGIVAFGIVVARVTAAPAGILTDIFGSGRILTLSSILACFSALFIGVDTLVANKYILIVSVLVLSASTSLQVVSLRVLVPECSSEHKIASGYASLEAARVVGKIMGPASTLYFISQELYSYAFFMGAFLYALGALFSVYFFQVGQVHKSKQTESAEVTPSPLGGRLRIWLVEMSNITAAWAIAVAGVGIVNTWGPVFFERIAKPEMASITFIISSVLAIPFLMFFKEKLNAFSNDRLSIFVWSGIMILAVSLVLVSIAPRNVIIISAAFVIAILSVEFFIAPGAQSLLAKLSKPESRGFYFGLFGIGEAIGGTIGAIAGAELFALADEGGNYFDYWGWIGISLILVSLMVMLGHVLTQKTMVPKTS